MKGGGGVGDRGQQFWESETWGRSEAFRRCRIPSRQDEADGSSGGFCENTLEGNRNPPEGRAEKPRGTTSGPIANLGPWTGPLRRKGALVPSSGATDLLEGHGARSKF